MIPELAVGKRKKVGLSTLNDWAWGYGMILPLFIGLSVFYFYPAGKVIYDSFYEVGAFGKRSFVGLENYQSLLEDTGMWASLVNSLLYTAIIVPVTVALAMILAGMLNSRVKGLSAFRVIYFIPAVTMSVAVSMMWRWIFNGDFGILNQIIQLFGGAPVRWLGARLTAMTSISIVSIWMGVGLNMVILLAAIQGVPAQFYEAATLDGASGPQKFFSITVPLISPAISFVSITTMIGTLQIFDVIFMMMPAKSSALTSTQSIVMYFFRNAFEWSRRGYASAIAVLLFVIILVLTILQLRLQRKWVNYDS